MSALPSSPPPSPPAKHGGGASPSLRARVWEDTPAPPPPQPASAPQSQALPVATIAGQHACAPVLPETPPRTQTHRSKHLAWDRHYRSVRIRRESSVVAFIHPAHPAPPQAHTEPVIAEGYRSSPQLSPLCEGLPAPLEPPEVTARPPLDGLSGGPHPRSNLIRHLSVLAQQNGRSDPRINPRAWNGRMLSEGTNLAREPLHEESDSSGDETAETQPTRFKGGAPLYRFYSERPASPEASPSTWVRIRKRLESLASSVHSTDPEPDTPSYAGSGWGRQRLASSASNTSTYASAGWGGRQRLVSNASAYPGPGWGRRRLASAAESESGIPASGWTSPARPRRRALSELAPAQSPHTPNGGNLTPTSTRGFRHNLSRQNTLPLSGTPGFIPLPRDARFGGSASVTWAAEELARAQRRRRPIPVKLVGRKPSEDETSSSSTTHLEREDVVSRWLASHLQTHFPARLRAGDKWELVYSLDHHGISLKTLYSLTSQFFNPLNDPEEAERSQGPFALLEKELERRTGMTKPPIPSPYRSPTYPLPCRADTSTISHRGSATEALRSTYRNAPTIAPRAPSLAPSSRNRPHHLSATMSHRDAGLVLAVRDTEGNVFGAFVNTHLRIQSKYYGSGSSFLWKATIKRKAESDPESDSSEGNEDASQGMELVVYPWTGKNDFIILSEAQFLSFGYGAPAGSNGGYGLWLDGELKRGSSARCATFDNDVLCSPRAPTLPSHPDGREEEYFDCLQLELWAVGLTS